MAFIKKIRANHLPDSRFHLISNGNVDLDLVSDVERDFNSITISIVSFQKVTYKKILGLSIEKTKAFAERLIQNRAIKVSLKYLVTPLNIHEQNLFLDWALALAPSQIQIAKTGGFNEYINKETSDNFWGKITNRSVEDVRRVLKNCDIGKIKNTNITIQDIWQYGIDDDFIDENGLRGIITEYDT